MQKLQNGEILSIIEDDDEISIGIDLNSNTGIRLAAGNEQVWRREAKREWDKYNFGIFGCWTMDEMVILTISMRRTTLKKSGMSRRNKVCV